MKIAGWYVVSGRGVRGQKGLRTGPFTSRERAIDYAENAAVTRFRVARLGPQGRVTQISATRNPRLSGPEQWAEKHQIRKIRKIRKKSKHRRSR
ncbi:MAG: hypothetical protein ACYDH4_11300 [Candidatus Cryosericum sp.]